MHRLVLPLMLPSFYSELFTLYLLLHEQKDGRYSQGIASLSLFPDTKLLEFLDVQKYAWFAWGEIEDASSHRGWRVEGVSPGSGLALPLERGKQLPSFSDAGLGAQAPELPILIGMTVAQCGQIRGAF